MVIDTPTLLPVSHSTASACDGNQESRQVDQPGLCHSRRPWPEVAEGVEACARSCPYFPLCRGGAPSNKLAERGSFDVTETMNCRLINQACLSQLARGSRRAALTSPANWSAIGPTTT